MIFLRKTMEFDAYIDECFQDKAVLMCMIVPKCGILIYDWSVYIT